MASASSGLPAALALVSGPATLNGAILTLTGAGTAVLRASQEGDANHLPAAPVERPVPIAKATATLALAGLDRAFDGTPKAVTVTVTPPGLLVRVTYAGSPTPPTAAGEYAVNATVDDPNYQGTASGTLRIDAVVNVAGTVFHDLNSDGQPTPGEPGLPLATLRLLDLDGTTELRSTPSGADGRFEFRGVPIGSYFLAEQNPEGYSSTSPDLRLVVVNGQSVTEVHFGDQQVGTIAGEVFHDTDADGTRDANEPGLADVLIRLTTAGTSRTTRTGPDGAYAFASVTPGIHAVEETDPAGYSSTTPNLRNVSVAAGGAATASFGDQQNGFLTGVVFDDRDADGSRQADEPGLAGVQIRLQGTSQQLATVTDAAGEYRFAGIPPGSYTVEETDPAGYLSTTPNSRAVLLVGGSSAAVHFGDQPVGLVSGLVFEDTDGNGLPEAGEPGLGGVLVRLTGTDGQRTATTFANGTFVFTDVGAGSYTVEEVDPAGFSSTTPNVRPVSIAPGGAASAHFGDQAAGTVSGMVYEDLNGNGSPDGGEPGLGGVVIRLSSPAGHRQTTTSGSGEFVFAGVAPGTYTVEETDPVGFSSTTANLRTVTFASGGAASASFGDQAAGSVSGVVFDDANGNGLQEPGESGIPGVALRLVGANSQRLATTTGDGSFLFPGVDPGAYTVEETDPPGFSSTTPNVRNVFLGSGGAATATFGDQASGTIAGMVFADLNGNGLRDNGEAGLAGVSIRLIATEGGQRSTTTAGDGSYQFPTLVPGAYTVEELDPVGFASTTPNLRAVHLASGGAASASFGDQPVETISGLVFEDQNGNGQADPGEPGIGGVKVLLLPEGSDTPIRDTLTSGNGVYVFAQVPAGDYVVRPDVPDLYTVLVQTQTPSARAALHAPASPADVVERPVRLDAGGSGSASFALQVAGQLSGVVFDDLDGNGEPGPGEPGLGGVRVEARQPDTGILLASTLTTGSGLYLLPELPPGRYRVAPLPLAGYVASTASVLLNLPDGGAAVANLPHRAAGSITGRVFNDENGNGLHEPSEPGLGGVQVTLARNGEAPVVAATSGDGAFVFQAVAPGAFTLSQTPPAGFRATTPASITGTLEPGAGLGAAFGNQSESVQPPRLVTEPADQALPRGATASFKVVAEGPGPLAYQWLKDGTPLAGRTQATLTLTDLQPADVALYQVRVSNPVGTVLSRNARLTLATADAYAAWTALLALPANLRGPADDPDRDGAANLLEFVLGTRPDVPETTGLPARVEAVRAGAVHLGFELNQHRQAGAAGLFLEASDDLVTWAETPSTLVVLGPTADGQRVQLLDQAALGAAPYRFLRLGVRPPAQAAAPATLQALPGSPLVNGFRLALTGTPGSTYALERSGDLRTWTFVRDVTAGPEPVAVSDPDTAGSPHRFYRAVAR